MDMPKFETLTPQNFPVMEPFILKSEEAYPEQIRSSHEDYSYMLEAESAVAIVEMIDSRYAGNIIGCEMEEDELAEYGVKIETEGGKVFYIYNFVIDREYQGKGYAHMLFLELVKAVKAKGYSFVVGHFRQNGSFMLMKKLGGRELGISPNWENSGEDYVACVLDLRKFETLPQDQETTPHHDTEQLHPNSIPVQPARTLQPVQTPEMLPTQAPLPMDSHHDNLPH